MTSMAMRKVNEEEVMALSRSGLSDDHSAPHYAQKWHEEPRVAPWCGDGDFRSSPAGACMPSVKDASGRIRMLVNFVVTG